MMAACALLIEGESEASLHREIMPARWSCECVPLSFTRIVLPAISALVLGAEMVDLAGVIEVMLDHHRDDPTRLLALAPVRQPRAQQLGVIVEGGDTQA